MEYPTPKVQDLCFRLTLLVSDLEADVKRLQAKLGVSEEVFVLNNDPWNIVDRKKEKERHRKRWKVTLREILTTGIEDVEYL